MTTIKKKKHFKRQKRLNINTYIRAPEVRVIMPDSTKIVMKTSQAIEKAKELGLDLIEVSPKAKPPVCKIVDVGKYKYELEKKTKESKKHQIKSTVKEMRMSPKIQDHDYQTKMTHVKRFLEERHKVKVNILFKGREITHQELGMAIAKKTQEDLEDLAQLESGPRLIGRTITLIYSPSPGGKKSSNKKANNEKVNNEKVNNEKNKPTTGVKENGKDKNENQ